MDSLIKRLLRDERARRMGAALAERRSQIGWPSDVATDRGHAQCDLAISVDQSQVIESTTDNVGAATLTQIREIVSVMLGL